MVPHKGTKPPLLTPKIAQTIIIQHKIGINGFKCMQSGITRTDFKEWSEMALNVCKPLRTDS